MLTLEIRGLPAAEVRRYLLDDLGGTVDGDAVTGEGWSAQVTEGSPASVGSLRVAVLFVTLTGPGAGDIAAHLRRRTMRGGG